MPVRYKISPLHEISYECSLFPAFSLVDNGVSLLEVVARANEVFSMFRKVFFSNCAVFQEKEFEQSCILKSSFCIIKSAKQSTFIFYLTLTN